MEKGCADELPALFHCPRDPPKSSKRIRVCLEIGSVFPSTEPKSKHPAQTCSKMSLRSNPVTDFVDSVAKTRVIGDSVSMVEGYIPTTELREKVAKMVGVAKNPDRQITTRTAVTITNGRVEIDAPLGVPDWLRNATVANAKNQVRFHVAAARLARKLEQRRKAKA